jgi:predicted  nucleic acid-binding Zn-ribbon protein
VANETLPATQNTSTAVALFQKAHGRMTTLQRIDEQIAALAEQRRKIQEELRAVQTLINEEFDRVVRSDNGEVQGKMLTQIAEAARDNNGHRPRIELTEAVG